MTTPEARALVLVGPFPPLRGGIAQFDARSAHALRARGHAVSAVSFSRLYPRLLFPGRSPWIEGGRRGGEAAAVIDAVRPDSWPRAARLIRDLQADAVLAAYWSPVVAPALGWIGRRSGAPVIAVVHNARPHERLPLSDRLGRYFLSGCDGVLTLSEGVADDVRTLGFQGPVQVTPHPSYDPPPALPPVRSARAELGLPEAGPVLLFFGLVRPYKGLDVLIEAMPAIVSTHPGTTLMVAGEWYGDAMPARRRIEALGLADRVRIDDRYIPDDELPVLFGAADLVVQPYRSATQSGVLLMAASFGVPGVVTDVGDLAAPMRAHGAGVVVPPNDPEALAAGVCEALEPARHARLSEGAVALAAARGWDGFAAAVENLLTDMEI